MGGEHIKANLERKKFADTEVCWQEWELTVLWGKGYPRVGDGGPGAGLRYIKMEATGPADG